MDKFIPYEKLSKKEKRKIDQARRQTWGELNPVTRKPISSKVYNKKSRRTGSGSYRQQICDFLYLRVNHYTGCFLLLCYLAL